MNWLPIIAALGLAVAGLGIVWRLVSKSEASGKAQAENEQKGAIIDAIREHEKIRADVDSLPAGDARRELHEWSRR